MGTASSYGLALISKFPIVNHQVHFFYSPGAGGTRGHAIEATIASYNTVYKQVGNETQLVQIPHPYTIFGTDTS